MDRDKWEYYTTILRAELTEPLTIDYRQLEASGIRPGRFTPLALIPELDRLGRQGWQMISIQPVLAGDNDDIFIGSRNQTGSWTNAYLCAFMRPAS